MGLRPIARANARLVVVRSQRSYGTLLTHSSSTKVQVTKSHLHFRAAKGETFRHGGSFAIAPSGQLLTPWQAFACRALPCKQKLAGERWNLSPREHGWELQIPISVGREGKTFPTSQIYLAKPNKFAVHLARGKNSIKQCWSEIIKYYRATFFQLCHLRALLCYRAYFYLKTGTTRLDKHTVVQDSSEISLRGEGLGGFKR